MGNNSSTETDAKNSDQTSQNQSHDTSIGDQYANLDSRAQLIQEQAEALAAIDEKYKWNRCQASQENAAKCISELQEQFQLNKDEWTNCLQDETNAKKCMQKLSNTFPGLIVGQNLSNNTNNNNDSKIVINQPTPYAGVVLNPPQDKVIAVVNHDGSLNKVNPPIPVPEKDLEAQRFPSVQDHVEAFHNDVQDLSQNFEGQVKVDSIPPPLPLNPPLQDSGMATVTATTPSAAFSLHHSISDAPPLKKHQHSKLKKLLSKRDKTKQPQTSDYEYHILFNDDGEAHKIAVKVDPNNQQPSDVMTDHETDNHEEDNN